MDNDDLPVGRVLGRREALRLLAFGGSAALVAGPRLAFGAEGARMAELQAEGVVEHLWLKADWSGAALVLSAVGCDWRRS